MSFLAQCSVVLLSGPRSSASWPVCTRRTVLWRDGRRHPFRAADAFPHGLVASKDHGDSAVWDLLGDDVTVFRMQRYAWFLIHACVSLRIGRIPSFFYVGMEFRLKLIHVLFFRAVSSLLLLVLSTLPACTKMRIFLGVFRIQRLLASVHEYFCSHLAREHYF